MKNRILLLALNLAAVTIVGCGKGDLLEYPKNHHFEFEVNNKLDVPVTFDFDAYYGGYCNRSRVQIIAPAKIEKKLKVDFVNCVNGGGESIDSVYYSIPSAQDGAAEPIRGFLEGDVKGGEKIICDAGRCEIQK